MRAANAGLERVARALGETGGRFDDPYVPVLFAALLVNAGVRSLNGPARGAFLPQLVPPALFGNAVTWNSSLFEVCSMAGPAVGPLQFDEEHQWDHVTGSPTSRAGSGDRIRPVASRTARSTATGGPLRSG